MATLLILLLVTLAPATVLLVAGFWLVQDRRGNVSYAIGVVAFVLGLMLVILTIPIALLTQTSGGEKWPSLSTTPDSLDEAREGTLSTQGGPRWAETLDSDDSGGTAQSHAADVNLPTGPVLELGYDDSWVADVPEVIGGYRVIHIGTPKSVTCSSAPLIVLLAPQKSMDEYLGSAPDVRSLLQSIPGIPSDVQLSFAGSVLDEEEAAAHLKRWNERNLKDGCIQLGGRSGGIELDLPDHSAEPR